jgi:hypothetical protein
MFIVPLPFFLYAESLLCKLKTSVISNNSGFRQKHTGVLDSSDSSDGTSYPLMENYMLPVTLVTRPCLLD